MTQPKLFGSSPEKNTHSSLEEAYYRTLKDLLDSGNTNEAKDKQSTGGGKKSLELLNYNQEITNIRKRVMSGKERKINFPAAVARFVWMMSGSDRLSDIAFYEPKVSSFTDDGVSIPGSSYGQRILRPTPGVNQLKSVVKTLQKDSGSRRAAISIYQAEDAGRDSKDIPCTFGLFYCIRNGILHSSTIMRSNNAFILFPYNIFEFSLLSEVVATELDVDLGPLNHYAFSMHIYEANYEGARKCTESKPAGSAFEMRAMPKGSEDWEKPLEQIRRLTILESIMRHQIAGVSLASIDNLLDTSKIRDGSLNQGESRADLRLNEYWLQFYYLLILHSLINNTPLFDKKREDGGVKYYGTPESLKIFNRVHSLLWKDYQKLANFPDLEEIATDSPTEIELPNFQNVQFLQTHQSPMNLSIKEVISEFEERTERKVPWTVYASLQEEYLNNIAARQSDDVKASISRRLEHAMRV